MYTVKHPYSTSCITFFRSHWVSFALAFGCATPVVGSLSSRSSRSGIEGGLIAYPIGAQQLTKQTNQRTGGHAAWVSKYISTPSTLCESLPVNARIVLVMTAPAQKLMYRTCMITLQSQMMTRSRRRRGARRRWSLSFNSLAMEPDEEKAATFPPSHLGRMKARITAIVWTGSCQRTQNNQQSTYKEPSTSLRQLHVDQACIPRGCT